MLASLEPHHYQKHKVPDSRPTHALEAGLAYLVLSSSIGGRKSSSLSNSVITPSSKLMSL